MANTTQTILDVNKNKTEFRFIPGRNDIFTFTSYSVALP